MTTNPIFNPQPNYSGVTIQIANPAVNVGQPVQVCPGNIGCYSVNNPMPNGYQQLYPQNYGGYLQGVPYSSEVQGLGQVSGYENIPANGTQRTDYRDNSGMTNPMMNSQSEKDSSSNIYPQASYPAEYYINKYGEDVSKSYEQRDNSEISRSRQQNSERQNNENSVNNNNSGDSKINNSENIENFTGNTTEKVSNKRNNNTDYSDVKDERKINTNRENSNSQIKNGNYNNNKVEQSEEYSFNRPMIDKNYNTYRDYPSKEDEKDPDMTASQTIIGDINSREAEMNEKKKNSKETKIIALTDDYIRSLENYLNNPNDEIRLMASKEILKRLDEDKDRYDDAALNALLNKMLQDPSKLIRIAALSAFASQLASGNDYTVKLLQNIQSNPNADKEDILQASDILLKMTAGVEVKNIPVPPQTQQNQ